MFHIDALWIENYRALQGLRLERCGQVNLLMGHNNSGKTSVLEGLYLFARPRSEAQPPRGSRGAFRLDAREAYLQVRAQAKGKTWHGQIWLEDGALCHEVLQDNAPVPPESRPNVWFIPPLPHAPESFEGCTDEELELLVKVVRDFDPTVQQVTREGTVFTGYGQMPLESFGEGTRKGVAIAMAMLQVRGGIVLIDEIETAFHPRIVPLFGVTLWELSQRLDVQLFLTTHSLDWIDTFLEIPDARDKLVGYRLESDEGSIYARRFTYGRLMQMRQSLGLDVR